MAGVAVLAASILRRDRLKSVSWAAAIGALVLYTVATYQSTYGSPEQMATYATVVTESPAARAFSGRGYGLADPNLGALVANETLSFVAVAIALMSIFLVVRNTRAEEEDGMAELLAAGQISRHARSISALAVAVGTNIVVSLLLAAVLIAYGLGLAGALAYACALALCGIFFAALALLGAQLSIHARVANALAGGALGIAYLIRALGDMSETWLSWLSPIGWAQAVRPFANERPEALVPLLVGAAILAATALVLESRRDLGAGVIGSRPGPSTGRSYLSHPLGLPFRIQRVALAAWLIGACVLGITYGSVTDEVEQMIGNNRELADFLAQTGGDLVDSYFVTVILVIALLATAFATQSLLRIRAEEITGRAEIVLATALGRLNWLLGYLAITVIGVAAILLVGGGMVGLGYRLAGGEASEIYRLALVSLAWTPAVLAASGLALLVIAFLPRIGQAAWALLGVFAAFAFFGQSLEIPQWLLNLSPFEHAPQAPAEPLSLAPILLLAGLAVALAAAGLARIGQRDIG